MHMSSMAPRVQRRRARIAIFAASLEPLPGPFATDQKVPDDFPANDLEIGNNAAISSNFAAECVGQTLLHGKWKSKLVE
jgi:hypothetical protein